MTPATPASDDAGASVDQYERAYFRLIACCRGEHSLAHCVAVRVLLEKQAAPNGQRGRLGSRLGTPDGNLAASIALTNACGFRFPKFCSHLLFPEMANWRRRNGKDRG